MTTKRIRDLEREFGPHGCSVSRTRGDHIKITPPRGQVIFCASTPSDHRADKNLRALVRRTLDT